MHLSIIRLLAIFSFIIFCAFVSNNSNTTTGDSIKIEKSKKNIDDSLNKYSDLHLLKDSLNRKNLLKTMQLANEIEYTQAIIKGNVILGKFFNRENYSDSGLHYLYNAWELALKENIENNFFTISYELGSQLWKLGDYIGALEFAIRLEEDYSDNTELVQKYKLYDIYNLIGLIYQGLNDYELAIKYYNKAIEEAFVHENFAFVGIINANIGETYSAKGDYDNALNYLYEGVTLEEKYNRHRAAGRSYNSIAKIFIKKNDLEKAEYYLSKAEYYNLDNNDMVGYTRTLISYGKLWSSHNNYEKAIDYLLKARILGEKIGVNEELLDAYNEIAICYASMGEFRKGYIHGEKYVELYQLAHSPEKLANVKRLEFELENEKQELKINQSELKRHKTKNNLLSIIIILSVVTSSLFIYLYFSISKRKKVLQQKNSEIGQHKSYLENLNARLTEAYKKAEESDKLKSHFLRNISHEIRTPLNGIIGLSELISVEELSDKERKAYYKHIKANSRNLVSTIDNLVDMAHLSSNQLSVNYERINLNSFCKSILNSTNEKLKDQNKENIILKSDISTIFQKDFLCDESLLNKITGHLIDNAIKFTDEGFISFSCECGEEFLKISIQDTGVGIKEENINLIFEQFRQGQEQLSREFEGNGLGLSITKQLVDLLNGNISVYSERGFGSTFKVEIPVKKDNKKVTSIKSEKINDEERVIQ